VHCSELSQGKFLAVLSVVIDLDCPIGIDDDHYQECETIDDSHRYELLKEEGICLSLELRLEGTDLSTDTDDAGNKEGYLKGY